MWRQTANQSSPTSGITSIPGFFIPHWPEQPDPSYGIVVVPFAALPNVAFGMTVVSAVFFHKVLPKPKAASEFGGCWGEQLDRDLSAVPGRPETWLSVRK